MNNNSRGSSEGRYSGEIESQNLFSPGRLWPSLHLRSKNCFVVSNGWRSGMPAESSISRLWLTVVIVQGFVLQVPRESRTTEKAPI